MIQFEDGLAGARPSMRRGWLPAALAAVLALLALVYFAWPAWRAQFSLDLDTNEGWNAHWADAVTQGAPLYPPSSALVVNNYPPLSFLLLGSLQRLGLDAVMTGRLLSLAGTVALALAAAHCIRTLGGGRLAALVGASWLLATFSRFFSDYVGMNDPHIIALAVMGWGLAWLLHAKKHGRALEPALLLMLVAGFYKHNLIGIPLTAAIWLLLRDRRGAIRPLALVVLAAAAGLGLCALAFGPDFVANLTAPRVNSLQRSLNALGRLQWVAPAAVLCALWAWQDPETEAARFLRTFLPVTLAVHLLQQTGEGVADNSQFELAFATAVGLGLAFDFGAAASRGRIGNASWKTMLLGVVILRLLLSFRMEPYQLLVDGAFRDSVQQASAVFDSEAARVAQIPGAVDCDIALPCRAAGKPYALDDFNIAERIQAGRMSLDTLHSQMAALHITRVTIDPRASADSLP